MLRKILIGLLVVLVIIQFIRPERNKSGEIGQYDITKVYNVPADVQQILKRACYDCHSNNTTYPWYANIQPVGFWLQNHINEGKEHLNFSEFGELDEKKRAHAFEEIAEVIDEDEMPLKSYTIVHTNSKLSQSDKDVLLKWVETLYPAAIKG